MALFVPHAAAGMKHPPLAGDTRNDVRLEACLLPLIPEGPGTTQTAEQIPGCIEHMQVDAQCSHARSRALCIA